ncbi:MAG TPA: DUF4091 domain-containing protein [Planctomycetota bacterium]|nr:DUF4091 domain-containing protein [Planctomycetota bacterium]
MSLTVLWCDEFVRLDPCEGAALDGENQAPEAPPVLLTAARGGAVSFQLLVGPLGSGREALVGPGGLSGPDGARIAASQFDVFVEWYHRIDEKWWPDALVPQDLCGGSTPGLRRRMGLPGAARFAGFWVDLHVPADAKPGSYSGSVAVGSGREVVQVPVRVEVAAARVPEKPCLDASFNNYVDSVSAPWPEVKANPRRFWTERYRRIERGAFRCVHDHRAFLHYLPYTHAGYVHGDFAPPLAGEGPRKRVADWSDWDRHFGPYFDGSAFRGTRRGAVPVPRFWMPLNINWPADFLKFGKPGYAAEWRAVGKQMVEHFRRKGWTGTSFDMFPNQKQRFRFVPWDLEEARFLPDQDVHRYFRPIWESSFGPKAARPVRFNYTLGSTWTYHIDIRSDLAEFIDLFIAGTAGPAWYPEELERLHRNGRQVWSCTSSGSIVNPTRAAAFTPLVMWMRGLDGFMPAWCSMVGWGGDVWHDVPGKGSTTFLYPGSELGSEETCPSLRMKVMRNAMQTVDLLDAAARRSGGAAVRGKVSRLLGFRPADWYMKRPAYVDRKLPKDWVGADYATEEPPAVGWQKVPSSGWRALGRLAAGMARGR